MRKVKELDLNSENENDQGEFEYLKFAEKPQISPFSTPGASKF